MPHVGGEKNKPARYRLNGAPDRVGKSDQQIGFAKFDPALARLGIGNHVRHGHIVAGAYPTLRMHVICVKSLVGEPG